MTNTSSCMSAKAFIESMKAQNWIVSTCDISGIGIPENYAEGAFTAPEGATLTVIFSRCPKTGDADISVWVSLNTGEGYWLSDCPSSEVLQALQRFGSWKIWDWVRTQLDWYRANIIRLNATACPDGYYVDYRLDRSGRGWLYYRKFGSEMGVKSCPYQYWLLR